MIAGERGARLSPREREVLTLYAQGLSRAEIAGQLVIAPDTVKSHLWRVFAKLGARNGRHAVALTHYLVPRERTAVRP